jgi:ADP-heptose:LPS heptosyltransferase
MKLWTNNTNAVTVVDDNKLWPRCSYILPDELVNPPFTDAIPVPHLIKPYYPGRAEGGTTAVYRAGAIGDAIMATGVIRYLTETSGGAVDVYCPARNMPLYAGLGARLLPLPPTAEAWASYDAHVVLDDLFSGKVGGTELGTGAGNHYDRIYLWMGAEGIVADVNGKAGDIRLVDAKYKKPYLYTVQPDTDELKKLNLWPLPNKYFAYHVSSSGPTRTYPPALGKLAVEALLEAFPDHHAVILGMDKSVDFRVDSKRVVDLFNATANIRTLFPVIQGAEFVVAPDSSVTHMAAGLDTACVSLWGSYHPDDRCKYYPKSVPVFKPDTCPHAPCRPHGGLPQAKCKDATNRTKKTQMWCNALRNITAEDIVEAAKKVVEEVKESK